VTDRGRGPDLVDGVERSEEEALRLAREAAPFLERVVYTRNRRVMVSLAGRGTTLRVDRSFAGAPCEVMLAAARLFAPGERSGRLRCREVVRAHLRAVRPSPAAPPRPHRGRVHAPGDAPLLERLQREFDRVNAAAFDGALPRVPLLLSRAMRRRNGHFSAAPPEIVVSRRLLTDACPGEAEATLRHEMIHLWQHASGGRPDHGASFRAWARRLDVHPRATRPVRWAGA
jgi:hypothetical protein